MSNGTFETPLDMKYAMKLERTHILKTIVLLLSAKFVFFCLRESRIDGPKSNPVNSRSSGFKQVKQECSLFYMQFP